jgi:quinol monooxygenase YgiN
MIMSMLRFDLKPDSIRSIEEIYDRYAILETAIKVEGCQTLVLATPDPSGNVVYVMGLWDDEAAYQRWMDHPERGAATQDLLQLVAGDFDPTAPAGLWQVLSAIYDADLAPNASGA